MEDLCKPYLRISLYYILLSFFAGVVKLSFSLEGLDLMYLLYSFMGILYYGYFLDFHTLIITDLRKIDPKSWKKDASIFIFMFIFALFLPYILHVSVLMCAIINGVVFGILQLVINYEEKITNESKLDIDVSLLKNKMYDMYRVPR